MVGNVRMLHADTIHKEAICGRYRVKSDFADVLSIYKVVY